MRDSRRQIHRWSIEPCRLGRWGWIAVEWSAVVGTKQTWRQRMTRLGLIVVLALALGWGGHRAWITYESNRSLEDAEAAFRRGHLATALRAVGEVLRIK